VLSRNTVRVVEVARDLLTYVKKEDLVCRYNGLGYKLSSY